MSEAITILHDIKALGLENWDSAPFLEKVTSIAPSIIYVFNQGTFSNEYANRSIGESLGYSPEEIKAMGAALFERLAHPDDLDGITAHIDQLKGLEDGDVLQHEYRMRHRDGHWTWLLSFDTVFSRDPAGNVTRHIGVANDITAQKQAEERELNARHTAELATAELRSFAYAVSHDMKSPSNTLSLLLQELREDHAASMDKDALHLLDLGQQTVEHMKGLMEDILNYTRLVDTQVSRSKVALGPLFDKVLGDMRLSIADSGTTFDIGPLPDVIGNEPLLRTLFVNLVSNAIKFQKPGSRPKITVRDRTRDGSDMVLIDVIDNGIGMPETMLARVFGMFNRLHARDVYPGSGLGLSLCKRIAVNHGGDISVTSQEGEGATFTIALRRA